MNQHTKILNLLENGNWVCSSKMYAEYIADPRTRLAELKKKGYHLISRWCLSHHHEGQMKEWKLLPNSLYTPFQTAARQTLSYTKREFCCTKFWNTKEHDEKCFKLKQVEVKEARLW